MSDSSVLPVQRFSPAPAIWIDRTEKSVSITGTMELFGPEATSARAQSVQDSINKTWTQTFTDGYVVKCSVTVRHRGPGVKAADVTQVEADKISGPSNVSRGWTGLGSRRMTLNANEADAFTWTPAHEFGHILGLDDRYSESIVSSIKGTFGGTRTAAVHAGYEGNLMAVDGGTIGSKNVRDLAAENEPSRWWINDDDQVRDWVNAHPLSDVTALSTASKLRAIHTLMGGWISDSDLQAIKRIAASVTDAIEADALRKGVDMTDFFSVGQRTAARAAFNKMPS
ncbi:MAG: hypothetical protein ACRC33_03185 [Gemmataceae bacterium]